MRPAKTYRKERALTGNWNGKTTQELQLTDVPWKTGITFSVLNGRIVTVVAEVRLECGEVEILDAKAFKSYPIGRGPQVSPKGNFGFTLEGVHIKGHLGSGAGSGQISGHRSGCHGKGEWQIKRVDP
ncbi:MAG TPA: hypothetical protein VFJ57_15135 [Solirubrobacterales bacterium]|nr:hypothetical protein [Solirubrobacterales bacterium]